MNDPKNTICPLRWNFIDVRVSTNEVRLCCMTRFKQIKEGESLVNNDYVKERRLEMLRGFQHHDCDYCWKLENQGLPSKRTLSLENKDEKELYDKLVANNSKDINIDDPILISDNIRTINLALESTCDLKCVYCDSSYSSKWATEDLKNKIINIEEYRKLIKEPDSWFLQSVWDIISENRDHISIVGFTGGEPSLVPSFYNTIDKIEELDLNLKENGRIYVFTNCNAEDKQFTKFIDMVHKITKNNLLKIHISIESTGERAEYIRYGLNWKRLNSNIDKLLAISKENKNLVIVLSPTICALTVPHFDEFIEWATEKEREFGVRIEFFQNIISTPDWRRHEVLPVKFKETLDNAISHLEGALYDHGQYIKFINSIKETLGTNILDIEGLIEKHRKIDASRGTNFFELFPEMMEVYENNKNR